ncbi:MAG: hypothetical protein ACXVRH_16515 [Thermoleophilaceae bacterium]
MPQPSDMGGFNLVGLLFLVVVLLLAFGPILLGRGGSSPGQSDSDSDDGGGGGPRRPRTPHDLPGGGLPLSEVTQSRLRLRGPRRLESLRVSRERRRSHEPRRAPGPGVPHP